MGCINLSEFMPLLSQLGYLDGEHYLSVPTECAPEFGDRWPTVDSLSERIIWLRNNKERATEIAHNAWRFTLRQHTYYNRILQIATDLENQSLITMAADRVSGILEENDLV